MQTHDTSQAIELGAHLVSGSETYEIISELGRGGMGVVYKALQLSLQRTVAIKMLAADSLDPTALQRLLREARISAALNHPNIVKVNSFNADDQTARTFLVMEYVEGRTLTDVLQEHGVLDRETFIAVFEQVLAALRHAHTHGLVHRDIKPSNIMVTADGTIRLMDFGIAKDLTGGINAQQGLTQTGALVGSPWYMSPEQCRGEDLDARSDLYSVGCMMYECLTGKHPFTGDNPLEVMYKHLHEQLTTTNDLQIPQFGVVIAKALSKDRTDRFSSAEEMLDALLADSKATPAHKFRRTRQKPKLSRLFGLLILGVSVIALGIAVAVAVTTNMHGEQSADKLPDGSADVWMIKGTTELKKLYEIPLAAGSPEHHQQTQKALGYFKIALRKAQLSGSRVAEADAAIAVSGALSAQEFDEALRLLLHADELLRERIKGEPSRLVCSVRLMDTYWNVGKYQESLRWGQESLARATDPASKAKAFAGIHFGIGRALFGLGRDQEGMKEILASMELAKKEKNTVSLCNSMFFLARFHHQKGQQKEAFGWLDKVFTVLNQTKANVDSYAQYYDMVAYMHLTKGNYAGAKDAALKVLNLYNATGNQNVKEIADLHSLIAQANGGLGDFDGAVASFHKAQELYRTVNPPYENILNTHAILFFHYLGRQKNEKALAEIRKFIDLANRHYEVNRPIHLIDGRTMEGMALLALNRFDDAWSALSAADAIARIGKSPADQRILLYHYMGLVAGKRGDIAQARKCFGLMQAATREPGRRQDLTDQGMQAFESFKKEHKVL